MDLLAEFLELRFVESVINEMKCVAEQGRNQNEREASRFSNP
jgi:hypothetical protein